MIKLKNLNTDKWVDFEITKFPDGTSQVWKINPEPTVSSDDNYSILWMFENEAEVFHILQLCDLLYSHYNISPIVEVPYLPYARQDKEFSNYTTWAEATFLHHLGFAGVAGILSFDPHSRNKSVISSNSDLRKFHDRVLNNSGTDIVCYPDKGASLRYQIDKPSVEYEKTRDQLTGQITSFYMSYCLNVKDKVVTIVDDLVDRGGTFIPVAQDLKNRGARVVNLCVSHGLFSGGKKLLYDAGIDNIYTTNSLLRNKESSENFFVFKVCDYGG